MEFYSLIHPDYREKLVLRATQKTGYDSYYAFPAIIKADDNTLLIAYKNGKAHGWDADQGLIKLDQIRFDIPSQQVTDVMTLFAEEKLIPQMGEYVKMPNGDICVYIDMQDDSKTSTRTGIVFLRSTDGGRTYGKPETIGVVDGVEYGYPFDYCEKNGKLYLLVMTFEYLTGSENRRQVHLISTTDNGKSWKFEANFTKALGVYFNESSIAALENGFALFTRGEAPRHKPNHGSDSEAENFLAIFDDSFNLLRKRDYRHTRSDFSLTGRPRIYEYEGQLLLVTRQDVRTNEGGRMTLELFRLDPETLELTARFRLDDPVADKQDGHYASLYFDKNMLRVIDYVTCPVPLNPTITKKPDIVQYSFKMDRLKAQFKEETGYDF